ncbi:MAG TPA: glycosyltransferase family 2 protein [Spirochaeta sp.]|nr:glycosyltransferase family 2 protein [Spirochaeta sp.]
MGNKTVSIITPLYNAEEFIKATADSVLAQTCEDFEWLIVNDSSTDSSRRLLDEIAEKDERIVVINLPENHGPIYARNIALEKASGRYIAFLDADDLWLPRKLELQIVLMRNRNAALSCTRYKKINKDGSLRTGITIPVPEVATYNQIMHSDSIMASSAMYDRNITGDIRQTYEAAVGRDDYHFFLTILKDHKNVYCVMEDLARLRVFSETLTGNKMKAAGMQWAFYRNVAGLSFPSSVVKFTVYAVKGFLKYLM